MEQKDEILWAIARKRASFKKQLIAYVIVNSFLWTVWFTTGQEFDQYAWFPWPIWVMFWWGIGLAICFVNAYLYNSGNAVEREYQKLKNQQ